MRIQYLQKCTYYLQCAQKERQAYRESLKRATDELAGFVRPPGPSQPLTSDLENVHYTFDYSQMVTIPHHSRQMAPLYFVSGRKVQIFGIRVDGVSKQHNYLIDEDQSIGRWRR